MMNSSRVYLRAEMERFAASLAPDRLVLDAGAGSQPYRDVFDAHRYETADFEQVDKTYGQNTYVCDIAHIPVADGRFDVVVFNQVMEHLPEPMLVLKELRRVLNHSGVLICTVPFYYEEHEQPYDFFRYTQFALKRMFTEAGFGIERFDWMEGYYGTLAYQLELASRSLPGRPSRVAPGMTGWVLAPLMAALKFGFRGLAWLFYRLDVRHKFVAAGHPKNYLVIARPAGC